WNGAFLQENLHLFSWGGVQIPNGSLDMNFNSINNLGGLSLSGNLNMNGNQINNVSQVDNGGGGIQIGSAETITLGGDLNVNSNNITNVNSIQIGGGTTVSNIQAGTSAAMVAGSVVIAATVTASSVIIISVNTPGGGQGFLSTSHAPGANFTVTSTS